MHTRMYHETDNPYAPPRIALRASKHGGSAFAVIAFSFGIASYVALPVVAFAAPLWPACLIGMLLASYGIWCLALIADCFTNGRQRHWSTRSSAWLHILFVPYFVLVILALIMLGYLQ